MRRCAHVEALNLAQAFPKDPKCIHICNVQSQCSLFVHRFQMIFPRVKIPKLIAYGSLNLVSRRDLNISKTILQKDIYLFTDGYGSLNCEIVSFSLTNKFLIFFFFTAAKMLACYKGNCFFNDLKLINSNWKQGAVYFKTLQLTKVYFI